MRGLLGPLRRRVQELGRQLWHEHASPGRLAAAVLVGCVIGSTPLFGFHILLCVAVAWLLRLNKLVVYAAAHVSTPPLIPLLGFGSVQIGERLLHGRWLPVTRAEFAREFSHVTLRDLVARFAVNWTVGGLVIGVGLGVPAAAIVYAWARRRVRARAAAAAAGASAANVGGESASSAAGDPVSSAAGDPVSSATGDSVLSVAGEKGSSATGRMAASANAANEIGEKANEATHGSVESDAGVANRPGVNMGAESAGERVNTGTALVASGDADARVRVAIDEARQRYRGLHPRFRWYARLKYVMDPCYRAVAAEVPPGAFTVDLGTGLGMLPVLLGLLGEGRRALGVEWDNAKVACGQHAARGLDGVEVVAGDVRTQRLPACDVITLVDVLHYYDAATQQLLLTRCRAALRPGGKLLVREGDRTRRGGARWTRAVEWLATRLGWNRGPAVRFRPLAALREDLEALGFAVRVDDAAGRLHPGNVLLVAVASAPATSPERPASLAPNERGLVPG